MKKLVLLTILIGSIISLSSCAYTDGQRQSVYQGGTTALGALIGQAIGHDTESTLIGAGAGYVAGGLTKEWVYPQRQSVVVQHQQTPVPRRVRVHRQNPGPVWCPPKPLCTGLRYAASPYERARQRQKCQVRMRDWRQ